MEKPEHLFADDSMTRLIDGQPIQGVGAGRILLLQLAHPLVAKAVSEHGDFVTHPWRRLARTMKHAQSINRGTRLEALAAIRKINKIHERVRGENYSAQDPQLLLWVLATMVQTSWKCYEDFIGPLNIEDKNIYWEETKYLGELFGIPRKVFPKSAQDFDNYFNLMVQDELKSTQAGIFLADRVLRPRTKVALPQFVYAPNVFITTALLPDKIREDFALRWTWREKRRWHRISKMLRLGARLTKI